MARYSSLAQFVLLLASLLLCRLEAHSILHRDDEDDISGSVKATNVLPSQGTHQSIDKDIEWPDFTQLDAWLVGIYNSTTYACLFSKSTSARGATCNTTEQAANSPEDGCLPWDSGKHNICVRVMPMDTQTSLDKGQQYQKLVDNPGGAIEKPAVSCVRFQPVEDASNAPSLFLCPKNTVLPLNPLVDAAVDSAVAASL